MLAAAFLFVVANFIQRYAMLNKMKDYSAYFYLTSVISTLIYVPLFFAAGAALVPAEQLAWFFSAASFGLLGFLLLYKAMMIGDEIGRAHV